MLVKGATDVSLRKLNYEVLTLINSRIKVPTTLVIENYEVVHEVGKAQNVWITQRYISGTNLQLTLINTRQVCQWSNENLGSRA